MSLSTHLKIFKRIPCVNEETISRTGSKKTSRKTWTHEAATVSVKGLQPRWSLRTLPPSSSNAVDPT